MPDRIIRAMCAIGRSGQLGLNGRLPWEGFPDKVYAEDAARFFAVTRGHVLLAGPKTISSVPDFAYQDRTIAILQSNVPPEIALAPYNGRVIYIGGGPRVWESYAHLIEHWDITRLPYDGPADRWFDPRWLTRGKSESK